MEITFELLALAAICAFGAGFMVLFGFGRMDAGMFEKFMTVILSALIGLLGGVGIGMRAVLSKKGP